MSDAARAQGRWRVLVPDFGIDELAEDLGVDPDRIRSAIASGAVTAAKVVLRTPMFQVDEIIKALQEYAK